MEATATAAAERTAVVERRTAWGVVIVVISVLAVSTEAVVIISGIAPC